MTRGPQRPGRSAPLTHRGAPGTADERRGQSGRCWAAPSAAATLARTAYPSAAAGSTADASFLCREPALPTAHAQSALPRRLPGAAEQPALRVLPGTQQGGGGRRPEPQPASWTESGRGAAGAQQPGFPRLGVTGRVTRGAHGRAARCTWLRAWGPGAAKSHEYCESARGPVCGVAPIGCRPGRCRCWNEIRGLSGLTRTTPLWERGPRAPSRAQWTWDPGGFRSGLGVGAPEGGEDSGGI